VKRKVKFKSFSRPEVKDGFAESGATTKQEIAVGITKRFPKLRPRLPRFRKPWMSEDYRMSIFDAVGLALTFSSLSLEINETENKRASIFYKNFVS